MTYQYANGHNNAGSLADLSVQPATPALIRVDSFISSDNAVNAQGALYAELVYTVLTQEQYNTMRTQFGLTDVLLSKKATMRLYGNDGNYANYNATLAHEPARHVRDRRFGMLYNVVFVLSELDAL